MTQIRPERELLHVNLSNWQHQWLNGCCLCVGLFGVVIAGASWEATSAPIRLFLGVLKGEGAIDLNPDLRFTLAVLGAVTIGWSLTMLAAIRAAERLVGEASPLGNRQSSQPIWALIVASIAAWYVIDSILSIATGFWLNAISNTLFAAAFFIPIGRSGVLHKSW